MRNFPLSGQRPDTPPFAEEIPRGRRCIALLLVGLLIGWSPFSGVLRANPSGGAVKAGQATINGGAGRLTVKQTSPTAIIHWQDFSIGLGETTQFLQPNSSSAALNRVVGGNPSAIYGTLQANGQVYLINPNGVLVGASGVINTAGFLASTLDVTDEAFEARGDLTFRGDSSASVVNLGTIGASEGDVILIARTVENHGTIQAPRGTVALAAGNEVLVKASGEERVFVQPEGSSGSRVSQAGLIEAATVELKAAGGNEYALAIKHSGVTRATGVVKRGGRIMLSAGGKGGISNTGRLVVRKSGGGGGGIKVKAGGNVANDGVIDAAGTKGGSVEIEAERASHTGLIIADGSEGAGGSVTVTTRDAYHDTRSATISARGETAGGSIRVESTDGGGRLYSSSTMDVGSVSGRGGSLVVTADELYLMGSRLVADGASGGGEILAGGGIQGQNAGVANATTLYVNQTSLLTANATGQGDGGTVVLWAEGTTRFFGQIEAKGGLLGGNGGFMEVSGKERTRFGGFATAEASMGVAGTLLLDPKNIVVDATASGGGDLLFSDNPADNITINAATITAITNTGTSLILQANNDITVNAAITTNNPGGNGGAITMQAGRSILLNANVTTDNGSLTLVANETLANGVVNAHRDAGNAVITMASGVSINAGTGTVSLTLADGAGKANLDSAAITLRDITGGAISVSNLGTGAAADLSLNGALTAGSGPISLIANRAIVGNSGATLTAQNQAITLNADRDATGGGNIQLTGTTITSNGGAITLGGGANPLTTAAIGISASKAGIYVSGGALTSGAGSISLLGQGFGGSSAAYGIHVLGAARIGSATGTGNITLTGRGGISTTAGTSGNHGVVISGANTAISTSAGAISITGLGGQSANGSNYGIQMSAAAQVISTGTATVTLNGIGGVGAVRSTAPTYTRHEGNNFGVYLLGVDTLVTSVSGDVSITGQGGSGLLNRNDGIGGLNRGIFITTGAKVTSTGTGMSAAKVTVHGTGGAETQKAAPGDAFTGQGMGLYMVNVGTGVESVDGDIAITGIGLPGAANYGIFFYNGTTIKATGNADMHLIGDGNGYLDFSLFAGGAVNSLISNTGDIIIEANTWGGDNATSGFIGTDTALPGGPKGRLIIRPRTAGTTIGIGGGAGTLSLTSARLGFIQDGFSEIIIGSETAGNTSVNAATFTDPLRLITGGALAINGALNTGANRLALIVGGNTTQTAALTAGSLRLGGNGNFTLLNAGNNIATLSKDGTGSLAYMDADSVAIDTVDGVNGLDGSSVEVRANTNITASGTSITTTGGTLILNSDRDATGGGNIQLTGTTITSTGGEIILSGGSGDANALRSTGMAVGSGTGSSMEKAGIYLSNSTLISGAGAITLRGEGIAGTDGAHGIQAGNGSTIGGATGTGAIALHGTGGAGSTNNVGIHLNGANTAVRSADGAILISGRSMGSTTNNHGIFLGGGAVVESTGTGAGAATIVLDGTGATGSSNNYGIYLTGAGVAVRSVDGNIAIAGTGGDAGGSNYGIVLTNGAVVESTGTGAGAATLNLTGTGGNGTGGNHGFYLRDAASRFKSVDGAVALTGVGQGSSGNGIHFAGNFQVETSGLAPLTLTATGAGSSADLSAIAAGNFLGGSTATGNITVNADTIDWGASLMSLQSTGALLIQPRTPTTTIGLGNSAAGTLNLTVAELGGIQDGFSEIIIGNGTAGNITANAATFTDSLRLITGGALAINGALNTGANRLALIVGGNTTQTAALTAGSLRLGGNGNFALLNAGNNIATLSKDGTGSLAYMDADSVAIGTVDGVNGLVGSRVEVRANTNITATATSITTTGGTIILNSDRDGVGRGNIQLSGTTIGSNGGNIVLGGGTDPMANAAVSFSAGSTSNNRGIYLSNSTIQSGGGDISMRGKGNDGDSGSRGIELSGSTVESSTGAVTMHGEGGAFAGSQQAGISLVTSTVASDSGSIDLSAIGGSGGNSMALLFWNGAEVLSRDNGTITLTGAGSGTGVDLYSGRSVGGTAVSKIGNHVDPVKGGNIVLKINSTNWASENTSFQSDGTLTIQPRTAGTTIGIAGGSGTLNLSLDRLNASQDGFSEIIIGSTDGGNITANAATFTDPLRLVTGGALALNGALDTGANRLALIVGGNTTQAAALTAGSLRLGGNGNFTLSNAGNSLATLAKDGSGSVILHLNSALNVGTVDGVNGVSGSTIDLRTHTGNLTLSQAVTGNASGNAVVLSTAGAFINNVGAAAVSTPNGRWLIYTAAPAGNTYAGLLSGNQALYHRSYAGNPPAGITESGNRYLFVNQPTLTFTSTNDSKTYGDDFTAAIADNFTVSGFVDAATFGNVFTQDTLANTISGTAVASSSGAAATAGVAGSPYSVLLDLTGVTATTGYTLSKAETGQLTVGQKALTLTANDQSKTYGDTLTFAGTEFSGVGLINGDTVTSATIGSAGAINTATVAGSSYAITIAGASGSGLGNYNISYVDGSLTVDQRDITVTALGGSSTYGDNPGNPGLSATNLASFDTVSALTGLSNSFGITGTSPAGAYVLSVDGTLSNGNYNVTSRINGSWSVGQKALTLTANDQSKTYGETFTFAGTEFSSVGLINGDTVTSAAIGSAGAINTATVAGSSYAITIAGASGSGLGNYNISYVDGSLTVDQRDITVTALGGSSTYGDSPGNPGLSATNLASFDTVSALTGLGNSFGITGTSPAGAYVLSVDGTLSNGNYNVTNRINGSWSVAQKALTVTAHRQRKTYGDGFTFAGTEFSSVGLINGDRVNRASLDSSGATGTAPVAGGPYLITVGGATGTGLGNYVITYESGLLIVTPAPLSIVANNASRALNQPNPRFTATISGFVLGEKLASLSGDLQFFTSAILGSPLGNYEIIPFGVASSNYEITFTPGTLTLGSPVENPLMTRTEHADAEKLMKDDFGKKEDETFEVIYQIRSYPGSISTLSSGEVP